MTSKTLKELKKIEDRYSKYGIFLPQLINLVETSPDAVSERAAILGIRMALAQEYHERDYFTIEDVMEITGETEEEVRQRMKELNVETVEIRSLIPGLFN